METFFEFETRLHVSNSKPAPLAVLFAFIPLNPLEKCSENGDKMVQTRGTLGTRFWTENSIS